MPAYMKIIKDKNGNQILPRTVSEAVTLSDGSTLLQDKLNTVDSSISSIQSNLATKSTIDSPTFTGTVSGVTASMVGLGNVDNTSDANKPISTAVQTALNAKEPTITNGTTAQYWRGDKSWQAMPTTLPASDVYAWAKQPNKPTYTAAEVGASATGHTHDYVPERVISDWNDSTVINNVTGLISWKNYGNGHVIFDASASTAPNGTSKNNSNPDVAWSNTYPTLMGWNGSSSYGVKVDRARYAESLVTGAVSDGSYYVAKMNVGTADATTSTCPVGFIYGKY